MSRTYREVPHYVSKVDLAIDFHEGCLYHWTGRLRDAANEKAFVKIALAGYCSDNGPRDGLSDCTSMSVTGAARGYNEWSRSDGWAKRYASKVRRGVDKAVIAGAVDDLLEELAVLQESDEDNYYDGYILRYEYDEYLDRSAEPYEKHMGL